MARKTLSDRQVRAIKPGSKRQSIPDPELSGHYLRVTPAGAKTFYCVARNPAGKQVWAALGRADHITVDESRAKGREAIARIKAGIPPVEPQSPAQQTFADVAESWLRREVDGRLRSARAVRRILGKYVLPIWGQRPVDGIARRDVTKLLDHIEDTSGSRTSDYVLAIIRRLLNWHSVRDGVYVSPVVKGMRRAPAAGRARILDDDEMKAVWAACSGQYGAFVRLCLLVAQRRETVLSMRWEDLDGDVWTIPVETRAKGNGGALRLPPAAMAILAEQRRAAGNSYVFWGRGDGHFSAPQPHKDTLDKASGVTGWTVHDLRRTARSLMARAGVRPEVAEKVLGHLQPGVEGIYDRHVYFDKKADALDRLARLVGEIVA